MSRCSRRSFLKQTARGFIATALGSIPGGRAWAQTPPPQCSEWGSLPEAPPNGNPVGSVAQWTCANHSGYKILDIWLVGGASPWETWWIPSIGDNDDPDLTAMGLDQLPTDAVSWSGLPTDYDPCLDPNVPTGYELFDFAEDAEGRTVYWGPASKPLWQREDIVSRARMMSLGHGLLPHQAARPYGLSGLTLGNPRRSGTGAAVQRRHASLNPDSLLPASYILHHNAHDAAADASVSGTHPGISRPVVVSVGSGSFGAQLARSAISPASDGLFDALRGGYTDLLRFAGEPVRSSGFGSYRVSSSLLLGASALQEVFSGGLVTIDTANSVCVQVPGLNSADHTPHVVTELEAAAHLLSQDIARYVCVIDGGLLGVMSYDTHSGSTHLRDVSANLLSTCRQLARMIYDPVANPSGTIDLNDTLVVINSEFGRTPQLNNSLGRDHWPHGYVSTLIGGPITNVNGGIRGGFSPEGIPLTGHEYAPTDVRGAMLLAAGIDPFGPDGLRTEEFSSSAKGSHYSEEGVRDRIVECAFGV